MDNKNSFNITFGEWFKQVAEQSIPEAVEAFSFNLFETADDEDLKFGTELIGASAFDPDDSDWACEEIWEPAIRALDIPVSFSGNSWEQCLSAVQALLREALETDSDATRVLKSRHGIGVGFVDGDMHIVWHSAPA